MYVEIEGFIVFISIYLNSRTNLKLLYTFWDQIDHSTIEVGLEGPVTSTNINPFNGEGGSTIHERHNIL